jgi:hypothetical protein
MDYKTVLDEILLAQPGVTAGKAFGYPCYRIGKKIFCWIMERGATFKLPAERVTEIIAEDANASIFSPDQGLVWREWVYIQRDQPDDLHELRGLFAESIRYVVE